MNTGLEFTGQMRWLVTCPSWLEQSSMLKPGVKIKTLQQQWGVRNGLAWSQLEWRDVPEVTG